jgi:pSer/pThr/pTyr-binding forkhead associated (FHA) protein
VIAVDPRLASFAVIGSAALFLTLVRPRRPVPPADDTLEMLSTVELWVEEPGGARAVRAPVPVTIGRDSGATVSLADAQVSRLHARIDVAGGELCVRDLASRNGTWLNALPIDDPTALHPGDEIEVGMTRIVYRGIGLGSPG